MTDELLQAEVDALRSQVEAYRQRELSDLRARIESLTAELAQAREDVGHYRREAQRNADTGRQIATEAQATIHGLRTQLTTLQGLKDNGRQPISVRKRP